MAKAATASETAETREDVAETPLLDTVAAAIKKMVARGKERGYLTYDELNAALPQDQVSSEQIEDTMTMLSELGINVIESEESEEPAEAEAEDGETETRGNVDGDDIGRAAGFGFSGLRAERPPAALPAMTPPACLLLASD